MDEKISAAYDDLIRLLRSALNGQALIPEEISAMDLKTVYTLARKHMVTAIAAYALTLAGIRDEAFTNASLAALRRSAGFDHERRKILAELDRHGIWYMPLKGAILQNDYPRFGMREMSDNDILFDKQKRKEVRMIMTDLGFVWQDPGAWENTDDVYYKEPFYNYEMHMELFTSYPHHLKYEYYRNIFDRLVKDPDNACGYHFTDEDFYVYMTAHEHKHFSTRGTGLRSLTDTYVFLQKHPSLDRAYIDTQLKAMDITGFEEMNRELSLHLFAGDPLSPNEQEMLKMILEEGTYGTLSGKVRKEMAAEGKGITGRLRYIRHRLILPMEAVEAHFPLFYKYRILLPFLPFYRLYRALTKRREYLKTEVRTFLDHKEE